jgi:hypothetical protein
MTLGCIFGALSFAFYYLSLSNFYEMEQWPRNPQFFTNAQVSQGYCINQLYILYRLFTHE